MELGGGGGVHPRSHPSCPAPLLRTGEHYNFFLPQGVRKPNPHTDITGELLNATTANRQVDALLHPFYQSTVTPY